MKLPISCIEFSPPMKGIEGIFNTFRVGGAWSKRVTVGQKVLLMDQKQHLVFASAKVKAVHVGQLSEMARLHASKNHNQRDTPRGAADNLIIAVQKRYGPHIAPLTRRFTVIYLEVLKS